MNNDQEKNLFLKKIHNPPFKSSIDYRLGTFNDFKKSLLRSLSQDPVLKKWNMDNDKESYGHGLISMWSYLCDIFTLYEEIHANESFIRTAKRDESVINLLSLFDYTPISGRSASSLVRFIANEKQLPQPQSQPQEQAEQQQLQQLQQHSSFSPVIIPQGFKVKSVPQKGQDSIIFETDHNISITPDHNLLKIDGWRDSFKLEKGTTTITLDKLYPELNSNDFLLITDDTSADVVKVLKKIDSKNKSQIYWAESEKLKSEYILSKTRIYKFTQVTRPFGYNASPPGISNLLLTFSTIESDNNGKRVSNPISGLTVQLVDLLDHPVDQSVSDMNGHLSFNSIFPSAYKILIKKDRNTEHKFISSDITSAPISREYIASGYESVFDAHLEIIDAGFSVVTPILTIMFIDKFQIDLTNVDILTSTIYLDRPYTHLEQESPVLIIKDSIDGNINTPTKSLYKISSISQEFHSAYGISAESSKITLKQIDGGIPLDFLFSWENVINTIPEKKELTRLIEFLSRYYGLLNFDQVLKEDDSKVSLFFKKNIVEKDTVSLVLNKTKTFATLSLNDEKIHTFDASINKTNNHTDIYRCLVESESFGIRNSLILTNPTFELRADPYYVSIDLTSNSEKFALEGVHNNLTEGMLLAITDNTSLISGNLVDSNLNAINGYTVQLYKTQNQAELTTDSINGYNQSSELYYKTTDERGSFLLENLHSDAYYLSIFLQPQIYWENFVKNIIKKITSNSTMISSDTDFDNYMKGSNGGKVPTDLDFLKLIEIFKTGFKPEALSVITPEIKPSNNHTILSAINISETLILYLNKRINETIKNIEFVESMFISSLANILRAFSELANTLASINIDSILSFKSLYDTIQISESEKPLRDTFLEIDKIIRHIQTDVQKLIDTLSNVRRNNNSGRLLSILSKELSFAIAVLNEASSLVTRALQTLPQSSEREQCFMGSTQIIDLKPNSNVKITFTLDADDKLSYVEFMQKQAKIELAKLVKDPIFKDGTTNLQFDNPLKYSYVKGLVEIYGNIVSASHGETIKNEIMGSGDASITNQVFRLTKTPLSHVNSPSSPNGIKSSLRVFVNDMEWEERLDFTQSNPTDRHYVASLDNNGSTKIIFGDGVNGSTTITGIDNILSHYRVGIGSKGNLDPNTPIVAAIDNPAVKAVSVPFGSFGGTDISLKEQKKIYTSQIVTVDRAVTIDDFSILSKNFGNVSKTMAFQTLEDDQLVIKLIVAASEGRTVDSAFTNSLIDFLDNRRDTTIPLKIESFIPVPVDIVVEVNLNDTYARDKVISQVETHIGPGFSEGEKSSKKETALFAFERLDFGTPVSLNEVYSVIEKIQGIEFAVVKKFCRRDSSILIQDIIYAKKNEILQCENDPLDPLKGTLKIIANGGIEL